MACHGLSRGVYVSSCLRRCWCSQTTSDASTVPAQTVQIAGLRTFRVCKALFWLKVYCSEALPDFCKNADRLRTSCHPCPSSSLRCLRSVQSKRHHWRPLRLPEQFQTQNPRLPRANTQSASGASSSYGYLATMLLEGRIIRIVYPEASTVAGRGVITEAICPTFRVFLCRLINGQHLAQSKRAQNPWH